MTADQTQSVKGGEAYQAGNDLTIINGIDADGMAAVMVSLSKHLHVHFQESEAKLDQRLSDLRESIITEFAKADNAEATKAFSEPDFQFMLDDAQRVYAGDGSDELRTDLTRLIVQRAKHDGRGRIAKVLNRAIQLAGMFSSDEYSAIAINFLVANVRIAGKNPSALTALFARLLAPFAAELRDSHQVYEFIESQGCASFNHLTTRSLSDMLYHNYAGTFSAPFTEEKLLSKAQVTSTPLPLGLVTETGYYSRPLRFAVASEDDLRSRLTNNGNDEAQIDRLLTFYRECQTPPEMMMAQFMEDVPGFGDLQKVWDTSYLSKMSLNAVGKAIGYSSLTGRTDFNAPLSTWVS